MEDLNLVMELYGQGKGTGTGPERLVYCEKALDRGGEHESGLESMMPVEH